MSVIQTIRNRFGKIAGGLIALALIGFIISDARNGTFGSFFGGHDSNVMKVDGTKIDRKDYEAYLSEYETIYAMFNKGRTVDDATRAQMDEQIMQNLAYEALVEKVCKKLGIQVTDDEIKDQIYGENANPIVRQFQIQGRPIFVDQQTGAFNPAIIRDMETQLAEQGDKLDPQGEVRKQWAAVKSYVARMALVNKFNALFEASIYAPAYIAKRAAMDQGAMANIQYVKIPFTDIADNEVKVTDDDLKAYMQKHTGLFEKDEETRNIDYVSFDIIPSAADTAKAIGTLTDDKPEFEATKDKEIKAFVNSKSDEANSYNEVYVNKTTFTSRYADTIMSLPVGSIFGPYYEGGAYKLTKVLDKQTLPDSVKCRHILVRTKDRDKDLLTDSAAKQRIDSAIALLKSGVKFDSVVAQYSEDEGSKGKGGEYTFTLEQRHTISKEFGDFIFEGKPGESKVVKVSNENYSGYHYIEIEDQMDVAPAVKLATITKNLTPSDSTVNAIYGKANEFAGKNSTGPEFDAAISNKKYDRRLGDNIKPGAFTITGLGPAREVVRWAYGHKAGDVSGVFQLGDQRYIVAKLTAISDKGLAGITPANRPIIEQRVKEEMKAAMIIKKYSGSASLDAVSKSANQPMQTADSVTLAGGFIPNLGFEPKVVGYAFCPTFQVNTLSPGIKGQNGVYYITVSARNTNALPEPAIMQMMAQQRRQTEMQMRNVAGQLLQQDLMKGADIQYNQDNF